MHRVAENFFLVAQNVSWVELEPVLLIDARINPQTQVDTSDLPTFLVIGFTNGSIRRVQFDSVAKAKTAMSLLAYAVGDSCVDS